MSEYDTPQKRKAPGGCPEAHVFGLLLRAAFRKRGLSVKSAAKKSGIPRTTLESYCTGVRRPSESNALILQDRLGISEEEMFGRRYSALERRRLVSESRRSKLYADFECLGDEEQDVVLLLLNKAAVSGLSPMLWDAAYGTDSEAIIEWFLSQPDDVRQDIKETLSLLYGYEEG